MAAKDPNLRKEISKKANIARAAKVKLKTEADYYLNPNKCQLCDTVIKFPKQGSSEAKRRKYCSRRCSGLSQIGKGGISLPVTSGSCKICCGEIQFKYLEKHGTYRKRKICDNCLISRRKVSEAKRLTVSKGDLRLKSKNYAVARSKIQDHAQSVFQASNKPKECVICNYNRHTDVCHVKAVKDFPDSALLSEINDISNLVPMCKNHHWEYDELKLFCLLT